MSQLFGGSIRDSTPQHTNSRLSPYLNAPKSASRSNTRNLKVPKHLGPSNEVFYNVDGAVQMTQERFLTSTQVSFRNNSPNDHRIVSSRYGKGHSKKVVPSLAGILGASEN